MRILANDFVGEFALNYWKEEKTLVISFSQKINSIQRKTQKVSKPHNEFISDFLLVFPQAKTKNNLHFNTTAYTISLRADFRTHSLS